MTPFKLVITLKTPLVMSATRTTLDALLSAAVFRKTGLTGFQTLPHIPLEKGEDGIFKGSSMFCGGSYSFDTVGRVMALKNLSDKDESMFKPNGTRGYKGISSKREAYKNHLVSYTAISARQVVFYGVGKPDEVVSLIENHIVGIGKCANSGAGEIESVKWEPCDDHSWVTKSGKPARPLPVEIWKKLSSGRQVPVAPVAVRLPYWDTPKVPAVYPVDLKI